MTHTARLLDDELPEISKTREVVLRAVFALIAVGQFAIFWPLLLNHTSEWALQKGNEVAILGGMTIVLALGVMNPVRMLPVLLVEFVWKVVWILTIYVPLARAGNVSPATKESLVEVGMGVVICGLAIPWRYAWRAYGRPGERAPRATASSPSRSDR